MRKLIDAFRIGLLTVYCVALFIVCAIFKIELEDDSDVY